MAPRPPLARLPPAWETWEATLDAAIRSRIQLGDKPGLTDEEHETSRAWRLTVVAMPVLPIPAAAPEPDSGSKPLLRRAHLVLTYLQHFYVHSLPPDKAPHIPRSISVPLLRVSEALKIPPLLTYSDTVLYNWRIDPVSDTASPPTSIATASTAPDPALIRSQTTFTSTPDEESFYLCSARIELRGAQALDLMRGILDEMFVGDALAVRRIAQSLAALARIVDEMRGLLDDVRKGCDPDRYFGDVRPWFNGQDVDKYGRKWVFEGAGGEEEDGEDGEGLEMDELSGPSAGQSSIVHVIDVFLGVDHESRAAEDGRKSFMTRMKAYMPYQHRLFIDHLAAYPRPLREFVAGEGEVLKRAYNEAVGTLKRFRDAHMVIAALYILGPARRARGKGKGRESARETAPLKGTGGTELVAFLKETRKRTMDAAIS